MARSGKDNKENQPGKKRSGRVRAITRARKQPPAGLVLTPGASADRDHRTLLAIDAGISEIDVVRLTLATTSVPRAVVKIADTVNELADRLGVTSKEIAIGGRSFGGRSCSVAHAEGLAVHSLVLLSYPLHPPGKPEKLRVDHFGSIKAPTLFVSGEKDPFGTAEEFAAHVGAIRGRVQQRWVTGNHSPTDDAAVLEPVRRFLGLSGPGLRQQKRSERTGSSTTWLRTSG